MDDFRDRVAVITGGASGIGRAIGLALADAGAHIVVADIDTPLAEQTAGEIAARGVRSLAVETDVAERNSVEALAERAFEEFGAVHLLFNNAGVAMHGSLAEMSEQDWQWVLSVNLWGQLHGVRAFLPRIREQLQRDGGEAHIVNTASLNGVVARNNAHGVYTASKYAVVGYSFVLREELAAEGIGVSVLCPSMMDTGLPTAGRNRQQRYGGPLTQPPMPIPPRREPADPAIMAPRILDGVRENRRFIFTHPDTRGVVEEYQAELIADYDALDRALAAAEEGVAAS
ncbi:MAG: SDR family NAD(P)-dependent oxidoreductase [Chloroflexi bacterium]|nr:SDR family NAD(P)-dependent oxidoreductase [Chloroflexota bacterium]